MFTRKRNKNYFTISGFAKQRVNQQVKKVESTKGRMYKSMTPHIPCRTKSSRSILKKIKSGHRRDDDQSLPRDETHRKESPARYSRTDLVHTCIDLIGVLINVVEYQSERIKRKSDELSRLRVADTAELLSYK